MYIWINNYYLVENDGFEPTASALQKRRSPNWANAPSSYILLIILIFKYPDYVKQKLSIVLIHWVRMVKKIFILSTYLFYVPFIKVRV